jgi:PiT family inorganic phosphate transporter
MPGLHLVYPLFGGLFLGWTLGANDAANVFGTAVATRIIKFRSAALLCGAMALAGAVLQGSAGIHTLSSVTPQSLATAVIVSTSAALTGFGMTYLAIPVSMSQAVVGAILGIGLATRNTDYQPLVKVVLCWIGTPIGAMFLSILTYKTLSFFFRKVPMSMLTRDRLLWSGLVAAGMYGSYALGANNVANTVGMFSGLVPGFSDHLLTLVGGVAIALGVITYSKRVMLNVGSGLMRMDAFTALVAVVSMSLTVHLFALIGAPVSTSQGIVGAIIGIGLLRGAHVLHFRVLREIATGWILTPGISLILAAAGYAIFL